MVWMNLIISVTYALPGFYVNIGLRTVSSLDPFALIFDENLQAAIINIVALPASGMTIAVSSTAPRHYLPSSIYEV